LPGDADPFDARPTKPRVVVVPSSQAPRPRDEILAGLAAPRPAIAPKYFYDDLGSRLFEAITQLPEYYLTRTEASILSGHLPEIVREAGGEGATLVDVGAGNCQKAARLFAALRPARYVAVDIAVDFLAASLECLQREFPDIEMLGVGIDLSAGLRLPPMDERGRRLLFYPGSSIGNFAPDDAITLLRQFREAAGQEGALLIGVDLIKETTLLDAAYDDPLGVTAAFNLNVLLHVNRLAGTDFDVRQWRHAAFFDPVSRRVEMHLEARGDVAVGWPGGGRRFEAGDRIHTENSYKYTLEGFGAMLRDAGFARSRAWCDPRGWFAVLLAQAR
jgi:dimethylhistidine N-methyltransferase